MVIVLILSTIAGYAAVKFLVESNPAAVEELKEQINQFVDNLGIDQTSTSFNVFTAIFFNNMRVAAMSVGTGFIPFLFVPAFVIIINGAVVGGFVAMSKTMVFGLSNKQLMAGLLPHGVLELLTFAYAASLGIYLCIHIIRALFKRSKRPLPEVIREVAIKFLAVVFPLILLAAIIEAFITPIFMNLVM